MSAGQSSKTWDDAAIEAKYPGPAYKQFRRDLRAARDAQNPQQAVDEQSAFDTASGFNADSNVSTARQWFGIGYRAALAAPVEGEPFAFGHVMTTDGGQKRVSVTLDDENPWGVAGENYSASYPVETFLLYRLRAAPPAIPQQAGQAMDLASARKRMFKAYSECKLHESSGLPNEIADHLLAALAAPPASAEGD